MDQQFFRRVHASGSHGQDPRAVMPGTGDVVRRVAYHDELARRQIGAEMFIDSLRGNLRQIVTVE